MKARLIYSIVLLFLIALLPGCSLFGNHPSLPVTGMQNTLEPPVVILPTANAVIENTPAPTPPAEEAVETPVPTERQEPLHFVFPTPHVPILAWRPALYPAPWALTPYDHFYFTRPIAANEVNWPLANYRYGGIFPGLEEVIHTGIDIDAPRGAPVLAAAAGKVIWTGVGLISMEENPDDPYGIAVLIRHDFGYQGDVLETAYAHLSQVDVLPGQRVEAGQRLGLVGDTGLTTGPHLHFEVRVFHHHYFFTRNPELWLAPPQGWGVLAGRVLGDQKQLLRGQEIRVRTAAGDQEWQVFTYGSDAARSDDIYQENVALSDLPAGKYVISLTYQDTTYEQDISIDAGRVSFFLFPGQDRIIIQPPSPPSSFDPLEAK